MITENTKIKFPLKQTGAILGGIVIIAAFVLNIKMQLQAMEIRQTNTDAKNLELQTLIDQNKIESKTQIKDLKDENSKEHDKLYLKLDDIYRVVTSKKQ